MTDPGDMKDALAKQHDLESDDDFRERAAADASTELDGLSDGRGSGPTQLVLLPHAQPLTLNAYLASALSGLQEDQRQLVFHLSDSISEICRRFGIEVYEPRKATDPVHHSEVPALTVWELDRDKVLSSDLLILLGHFPSTGAGEEIDMAYNALIPMILISHSETNLSRMVTGVPGFKLEIRYQDPEEFREQLEAALISVRPILEERKLAFAKHDQNIVGEKIRTLRQELGITREEMEDRCSVLTVDILRRLEESTDRIGDPSLSQLRLIAALLNTTVADLVEPDIGPRVVASLQQWMDTGKAARFPGMSENDSRIVLRKLLLRVIDALEEDLSFDRLEDDDRESPGGSSN